MTLTKKSAMRLSGGGGGRGGRRPRTTKATTTSARSVLVLCGTFYWAACCGFGSFHSLLGEGGGSTTLSSSSPFLFVSASGYIRLCPLKGVETVQLTEDENGKYVLVPPSDQSQGDGSDGDGTEEDVSGTNNGTTPVVEGGGRRRARRLGFGATTGSVQQGDHSPFGTRQQQQQSSGSGSTVEGRECPCAPGNYCLVGDGDTCGLPRNEGQPVGCFELNSRTVFIRNAWPVVVLWYGALFIFLLATDNGRNARNYVLSLFFKSRNRTVAEQIVSTEHVMRQRMRAAAVAQQRRLYLASQRNMLVRNGVTFRRAGPSTGQIDPNNTAAGGGGALVLKTKEFRTEDYRPKYANFVSTMSDVDGGSVVDGEENNNDNNNDVDSMDGPTPPSSTQGDGCCDPQTPKRKNKSPVVPPPTPDTVQSTSTFGGGFDGQHADSFDDDDSLALDEDGVVCTICLSSVDDGDRVGVLKCDHVFHADCLKDWLRRRNECPLCKEVVAERRLPGGAAAPAPAPAPVPVPAPADGAGDGGGGARERTRDSRRNSPEAAGAPTAASGSGADAGNVTPAADSGATNDGEAVFSTAGRRWLGVGAPPSDVLSSLTLDFDSVPASIMPTNPSRGSTADAEAGTSVAMTNGSDRDSSPPATANDGGRSSGDNDEGPLSGGQWVPSMLSGWSLPRSVFGGRAPSPSASRDAAQRSEGESQEARGSSADGRTAGEAPNQTQDEESSHP